MRRLLALPLGFLLVAAAGVAIFVEGDAAATAEMVPMAKPAITASPAQPALAGPASESKRDGRVHLAVDQIDAARSSGLWPGDLRSLLDIEKPLAYGEFTWNEAAVPPGPLSVRVDLRTQLISVFRGGHEIGTAVILYGADSHRTPEGTFPVLARLRDHVSRTYDDAPMPFTLRLTGDGVAIHGSDVRWGAATHGCIGVPLEFARRLFDEARVGDQVLIVRS